MEARRHDDQKGFNKDNGSYQNTRGYFRENNFRVKVAAEAMAGVLAEKEGNPPGRIIMIVRDRAPKKETTCREVVVVEDKIIKIEAGDMTNSRNIAGRYSSPQQGQYQHMPPPPTPPQSHLPTPPPYDPNWQLRQTQFYNSPAVAGICLHKDNIHNTQHPHKILETVKLLDRHDRQEMSVSCVAIKAILTINVSSQVIFSLEVKKHFNAHIICMSLKVIKSGSQGDDHNDHEQPFQ